MIALWKEWELDRILRQAYDNGIVLAGISAGANCWFEQCSTDSWPRSLNVIPCLGIIEGSFCPHYDGEPGRRPTLHRFITEGRIKPGYAADDGAAAHFIDEELAGGVSSRPRAKVYRVFAGEGGAREEVVETRYLGAT
jgi:peptidase E